MPKPPRHVVLTRSCSEDELEQALREMTDEANAMNELYLAAGGFSIVLLPGMGKAPSMTMPQYQVTLLLYLRPTRT